MDNKISIICPSFNVEGCIRKLIDSVLNQTSNAYELIIVDGGSKDGTMTIVREYGNRISSISENDRGIYDAMNKGIDLAQGGWLYFIGADDFLYDVNVIEKLQDCLCHTDADVILCKIDSPERGVQSSEISENLFYKNIVNHQGALYRKKIFENYRYNLEYKISADYDLNVYVLKQGFKVLNNDFVFANHTFGGTSAQANFISYKEEIKIRHSYYKNPFKNLLGDTLTVARYLYRKIKIALR